jgi:transcriptional regulator with XRE-family HTH domain
MRRPTTTKISAATSSRDFRTFLLVAQFEAKEIGARIAQARREAGLTQEQLAELAPFSARSLQDYETGVTIPYRQLREIGRLLDRPVEWLLHGESTEQSTELRAHLDRRLDALEAQLAIIAASAGPQVRAEVQAAAAAAREAEELALRRVGEERALRGSATG